jgi:hypothetical protein
MKWVTTKSNRKEDKVMNETRIYVRGTEEKCKEFTIDLTWFHSAAGRIGSINRTGEDSVTLNLLVNPDRVEDVKKWAENFGLEIMNW